MLSIRKRKTKLIWSISSSHCNLQQLEDIATEEWDGIRFVYDEASYTNMLPSVAQVRKKIHKAHPFAMMLDLAGHTRARISETFKSRELKYGETVTLTNSRDTTDKINVSSKHPWNELFRQDCEIYLGYGDIILKIMQLTKEEAICEVKQGGLLTAKMDLHIPATRDYLKGEDILKSHYKEFIEAGCNYIILPGWMSDAELAEFRTRCKSMPGPMPLLILKLDSIKVKDRLSNLIDLVDGVFISRKELALSTSPALVPMLTKEIIEFCILRSKTVITASDMLASMRHKPSPTRAEISDIANSVYDGSDAVVLSEDIFLGDYYHQALQTMDRAIIDAEEGSIQEINWIRKKPEIKSEYDAISYAAFQSAELLNAKAFVCLTEAGRTAISLASFRPKIPIIAVTFKKHVTDNLALVRGVDCLFFENSLNFDEVLPKVNAFLKQESWLKTGDRIIFVSVTLSSIAQKASNLFTVQRIQ